MGVTVIVDVLFVVAPAARVTPVLLSVKLGFTAVVTVTSAMPLALLYVEELEASGVKFAVSVSTPVVSDPAGTFMEALPLLSVAAADE